MMGDLRRFRRDRKPNGNGHAPVARTEPEGRVGVMIAVPSLTGFVRWSIANMAATAATYNHDPQCPWWFQMFWVNGARPFEYARNKIVRYFMENTTAEWCYMIDDDQEVPDNWFHLLRISDADVVSGTTTCWAGVENSAVRMRVNQYTLDPQGRCTNITPPATNGSPYQVPVVGTGCMAVRRRVFEKLGMHPFKMTQCEDGSIMAGEDVYFCNEVNKAGFRISVHPQVKFGHLKTVDLNHVAEWAHNRMRRSRLEDGKPVFPPVIAGFNSSFDRAEEVLSVSQALM